MTVPFALVASVALLLLAGMVTRALSASGRGVRRHGLLLVTWTITVVLADLLVVAVATGLVDPVTGRSWATAFVVLGAVGNVLLFRSVFTPWAELVLDAAMLAAAGCLMAWTAAVLLLDLDVSASGSLDLVILFGAAFLVALVGRRLHALGEPDLVGAWLLAGAATARFVGVAVLLLATAVPAVSPVAGAVPLAAGHLLLATSVVRDRRRRPGQPVTREPQISARLPYVVVAVYSPVAVLGLAFVDELRSAAFAILALVVASAMVTRQASMARHNDRLLRTMVERELHYRTLVQDTSDVIMIAGPDGLLQYVSPVAGRVLGRPAEECVGRPVTETLGADPQVFGRAVESVLAGGGPAVVESRLVVDGRPVVLESALSRRDERVLLSVRDVSERTAMRARLHDLASRDQLTGLASRQRFTETVDEAFVRWRTGDEPRLAPAVVLLDLRGFKAVNDTAGREAGDAVLREAADRLRLAAPPGCALARLGGDEFAVLLPTASSADAGIVTETFVRVLAQPYTSEHGAFVVGARAGISSGAEARRGDDLVHEADLAMAAAAADRVPWRAYTPRLQAVAVARSADDHRFARVLDDRRLELRFQPVVDLESGRPVGFESLLRWRDDAGVVHAPERLLAYASRTGRLHGLTRWVLGAALDEAARLAAAGWPDLAIGVNVGATDLLEPALVDAVRTALDDRQLAPAALWLELTEEMLLADPAGAIRVVGELRDAGVSLAIDDFGTGFSSLAYLVDLPVTTVKIDRTFVHALPGTASARVVVTSMIDMSRRLGLLVAAEGVETEEQLGLVRELGVDRVQGFLLAAPMTSMELDAYLAAQPLVGAPGGTFPDLPALSPDDRRLAG